MNQIFQKFQEDFEGEFHFDDLHKILYATDASVYRMLPLAVAFPKTHRDIERLIAFAAKHDTSIVPRTAGTSLAGQCVGEGIIVDVSKYFTEIISLDIENKTVTVQPGVIRDELNSYLEEFGLFFGPNTSTSNRCMIGGMVGNNSSGTTSIQYGVTRDKVLRLKTILSNGETAIFEPLSRNAFQKKISLDSMEGSIYRTIQKELEDETVQKEITDQFPKPDIHRRNTGYALDTLLDNTIFGNSEAPINLCQLLCGSEGTLAFTTEITLKLDALPPKYTAMVTAHYGALSDCLQDVTVSMKHNLFTCEMIDDVILDCTKNNSKFDAYRFFIQGNPKALLLMELKAETQVELEEQIAALLNSLKVSNKSYHYPILKGEEVDMVMELRKAGLGLLGNLVGDRKAVACIEDTAVALEDLPEYIAAFSELMEGYGQNAVYYAHAGAGELHLRPILNLKEQQDVAFFRRITTDVAALVKKYQGSFSGEHGDGIVRSEFLSMMIGEKNYALLGKIKHAFDPHQIFNPGKIVAALPMDKSLRYEPNREEPVVSTFMDFGDSEGILRLAESCNGSGDCRKTHHTQGAMCPSYHATLNEKDTTRARANALREVLTHGLGENKFNSTVLKEAFDLCLSCKACSSECPSNVDIATAKTEFLYQYRLDKGNSLSDTIFIQSTKFKTLHSFSLIVNSKWLAPLFKQISGIASKRSLPKISEKPYYKQSFIPVNNKGPFLKNVVLFIDEFCNYLEPDIARDAHILLSKLGYNVTVVSHLDSARALISKGFLKEAKILVDKNIHFLKDKISQDCLLVGIEPSAILGFRDEYVRLAHDKESAKDIAKHTFLIEEFLSQEIEEGSITAAQFTSEEEDIKIHVHCHQKALSHQKHTFDILNLPDNYKPTIINSGCCGMAGSFGYEKSHYELSMQIGELKLFPSVRKTKKETIIAANGTSCRHQIKDGTEREALHPVTILKNALIV